jgi:hypothetical protein
VASFFCSSILALISRRRTSDTKRATYSDSGRFSSVRRRS